MRPSRRTTTTTTTLRYFHTRTRTLAWRRVRRVCLFFVVLGVCLCVACTLLVVVVLTLSPKSPVVREDNPQSLLSYHRLLVEEEVVPTLGAATFQSPLMHPTCGLFPETSVTSLWNHLRLKNGASSPLGVDVSMFDLRRGIRTRPRISYWSSLLDKLLMVLSRPKKYLKVVLLVPPLVSTQPRDPQRDLQWEQQRQQIFTTRVQEILNHRVAHWTFRWGLEGGWEDKWNFRMVQVQHDQLQDDFNQKRVMAALADTDIVIDATGASPPTSQGNEELLSLDGEPRTTTPMTPDYQNQLRAQKQPWIRGFLASSKNRAAKLPSLILLDGLLPTDLGAWNAMAVTRGLQELADWYQIPFISVNSIIQPIKYQQRYASLLQTYKERSYLLDDEEDDDDQHSMASMLLQFEFTVDLIALAFVDFTIEHCQSQTVHVDSTKFKTTSHPPLPILKQGVERMTEYVVPPALHPSLSLQHVSEKWKQVANEKKQKKWKQH